MNTELFRLRILFFKVTILNTRGFCINFYLVEEDHTQLG